MPPTEFVILHHRTKDSEHWDFMIEQPDTLATWRLDLEPIAGMNQPNPASRIQDHRKTYLEYEGPISGDRGHVTQVDKGTCEILETSTAGWRFRLQGTRLSGTYELTTNDHNKGWLRPTGD